MKRAAAWISILIWTPNLSANQTRCPCCTEQPQRAQRTQRSDSLCSLSSLWFDFFFGGASCPNHHPERMGIIQPRVARDELPWGDRPNATYPERVASRLRRSPSGAGKLRPFFGASTRRACVGSLTVLS